MALQKTLTVNGVDISDCYIKVYYVGGTSDRMSANYEYKASSDAPVFHRSEVSFTPDMVSTDNFMTQAYNTLKATDEFTGALDV